MIYATRRPDTQKEDILACLAAHNFPLGMVVCSEGITSNDSGSLRTQLLRLVKEVRSKQVTYYVTSSECHVTSCECHVSLYEGHVTDCVPFMCSGGM